MWQGEKAPGNPQPPGIRRAPSSLDCSAPPWLPLLPPFLDSCHSLHPYRRILARPSASAFLGCGQFLQSVYVSTSLPEGYREINTSSRGLQPIVGQLGCGHAPPGSSVG